MSIPESETLRVYSPEGNYADTDLILCAEVSDMATPVAMLQAQYIRYGNIVYQFNSPEELGEAIIAVDPSSKHDAAALYLEEVARNAARAAGTLEPENPAPTADSPAAPVDVPVEAASVVAPSVETPIVPEVVGEPVLPPPNPDSLAEILAPFPETGIGMSSTTEIIMPTTTPAIDISSTTSE